ncbi:MAG: DUF4123 domain-containing protein [Phycisphaerales bacterium]|nr:DUF4123 domain-containing protein [Phycisphaerales bacterium]
MPAATSPVAEILQRAVPPGARLYALLDSACAPDGPFEAADAGAACESLFAGRAGDHLRDVAPYLAEFPRRSAFAQWWFAEWGKSVGILLDAPAELAEVRRHFRTLTIVRDARRTKYFFRFYDPRVLRTFLPTCTPAEAERFFGPVRTLYCEDEDRGLLCYSLVDGKLVSRKIPLTT